VKFGSSILYLDSGDRFVDSVWRCLVAEQTTPEQVVAFAFRVAAVLHGSGLPLDVREDLRLRLCQLAVQNCEIVTPLSSVL
jgi:hypothetical protein